jgi:hypothetical protein
VKKISFLLTFIIILSSLFLSSCSEEDTDVEKTYIKASSGTFSLVTKRTDVTSYHDSTIIDFYKTEDFAITDYGEEYYQIDTIKLTDSKISLIMGEQTSNSFGFEDIFKNLDYEQIENVLAFDYTIDGFENSSWFSVDSQNEIRATQHFYVFTTNDSSNVDEILSNQVGEIGNLGGAIRLINPEYYTHYSTTFYYSK